MSLFSNGPYLDWVDIETTATATRTIAVPKNSVVQKVWAKVLTAYDSATSASLAVGDGNDADGFLVAANVKAAAGTVYGDARAEVGAYVTETDSGGAESYAHAHGKHYDAADTIDATVTITGATTKGKVRVYALIVKLPDEDD